MLNQIQTFQCPNCLEYISTEQTECRFCHVAIDPQMALAAGAFQDKINAACNSAANVRNVAGAMWVFFALRFIPCLGYFAFFGLVGTFIAIPFMVAVWQGRYGGILTPDKDYKSALRNRWIALGLWVAMLVVVAVVGLALASRW